MEKTDIILWVGSYTLIILVFCLIFCLRHKQDRERENEQDRERERIRIRAGRIRRANPLLPLSNHGPHMCADPGVFHTTGTGESERPIGFAPEVMNGTTENEVPSAPLPSCPVEDSPPRHDTTLESSFSDHPCNNDIDPPSYEEVVSNETYYEQPSEPSEPQS